MSKECMICLDFVPYTLYRFAQSSSFDCQPFTSTHSSDRPGMDTSLRQTTHSKPYVASPSQTAITTLPSPSFPRQASPAKRPSARIVPQPAKQPRSPATIAASDRSRRRPLKQPSRRSGTRDLSVAHAAAHALCSSRVMSLPLLAPSNRPCQIVGTCSIVPSTTCWPSAEYVPFLIQAAIWA